MPVGMEVGLGAGDFVFDGDPATSRKGHTHPTQFLAHVYCGQMAGWMNTPLGTEVDLGTGHIVLLDVLPAVRERGTAAPSFRPCLLWPRSRISATAELLYHFGSEDDGRPSSWNFKHSKFRRSIGQRRSKRVIREDRSNR